MFDFTLLLLSCSAIPCACTFFQITPRILSVQRLSLAFSVLFQHRRLEGGSLSGHYLIFIQCHSRGWIHFWLEYCNWFVFGTKWVFVLSPCTLLTSVVILSNLINSFVLIDVIIHTSTYLIKRYVGPFDAHTHTWHMQLLTHNKLDLVTTMNEIVFPLLSPSVTVTITIYV